MVALLAGRGQRELEVLVETLSLFSLGCCAVSRSGFISLACGCIGMSR